MGELEQLGTEKLLELYRRMLLIRRFEERVYYLFLEGEIPGTLHQCQGQEAVAVGICDHLSKTDWITSTHRPHGHALAKGVTIRSAMAELYGKATGCCGGRGGSMHLGDPEVGMLPAIAIVGAGNTVVSGLGLAFKLRRSGQVAVCFFGEGATNEGAFHEGLNFAAVERLPVVFVCENNIYGASTPFDRVSLVPDVAARAPAYGVPAQIVDGMDVLAVREAGSAAIAAARAGNGPFILECKTYRYAGHSRGDARGYRSKEEEAYWKERDPITRLKSSLIEAGLADEAALERLADEVTAELDDAVEFARNSPDATAEQALEDVYLDTVYEFGIGGLPSETEAGASAVGTRRLTIAEALREAVAEEMRRDESVFLLGEDIGIEGGFGGAFGVYLGLVDEFGHDRIIDTPISEKAIAGAAVGAALVGMRPIADVQYADFLFECMDELVNQAAKMRYMSGGKLSVPMVMRAPVGATNRGAQHGQCPESYFMHVPGLKVVCVSDAYHAKGLLKSAVRDDNPVLVFEHKLLYGSKGRQQAGGLDLTAEVPEEEYLVPIGRAVVKRPGSDVTVVATHLSLYRSLAAADELAAEAGIECEVIDPLTLLPLDTETLWASVRKTGRLVIVHENTLTGGWGAEVAARAAEDCLFYLEAPIKRVASHDVPLPYAPVMEQAVVPGVERIKAAVHACI